MATEIFSLPVSTSLLAEVNAVGAPGRLKAQDGTIGDRTHMEKVSDHNLDEKGNTGSSSDSDKIPEVHARDVDARGPWLIDGGAERIVQLIVANVRAMGYARRRVKYVIFKGRIWVWRDGKFVQQVYTGVDQHTEHFHVSFMYGSGAGSANPENNDAAWGILAAYQEEDMPTAEEIAKAVWAYQFTRPDGPDAHGNIKTSAGAYQAYSDVQANTAANRVIAAVNAAAKGDDIDEKAIVAGVLAGMTPAAMTDAISSALAALPAETARQTADAIAARLAG